MKTYELTYIITPEITSEEAEAFAKEIEAFVQSKEGSVLRQVSPTAKTLSYPIKKHASGFMGVLEFSIEEEKLAEVKEKMDKDAKIVRHMIIIKKPVKEYRARRTRKKEAPALEIEVKKEEPAYTESFNEPKEENPAVAKETPAAREKVELKDIEQKLEELLGE
jgi:ribosomal protein S6